MLAARCQRHAVRASRLVGAAPLRHLAAAAVVPTELATCIDRFDPKASGFLRSWLSFSTSTMAVVTLRKEAGWSVPSFRTEAANLYSEVGAALASGDQAALRDITTPSCYSTLLPTLKTRPAGNVHSWEATYLSAGQ